MKVRLVLVVLTVALIGANNASAIDVPGGTFDEYDVGGSGNWKYVDDIAGNDWTEWLYGARPWIGNNYGGGYPTLGHSGAQWVDLNGSYIYQTLPGQTYVEGVTYEISAFATTTSEDQELYLYFTDVPWVNNLLDSGPMAVGPEADLMTWNEYRAEYTATAADAGNPIGIALWGTSDVYADTVTVTPEPMTIGLLGLGALMIRRKRS